ncbi:SCO2523 family variant P-loop protein [Actinosynnema sp. NPDC020468]|uniref:SCO2523 family variant P-loop protein n=1 Tax=Actinosynnema sp. NPDC020468 TaxID=3154488 RepID=UPI00340C7530
MIVFAASDKGGSGRTVTGCNVAYHLAQRHDVVYVDFDFGSPTVGAVFEVGVADRGIDHGGLHSYFTDAIAEPAQLDVWSRTARSDLRDGGARRGRLVLVPGDRGGAEFSVSAESTRRCVDLLARLDAEFDVCVVDLSGGRSYALSMALEATAHRALAPSTVRWLVFHRWTRQHVLAASGLVHGHRGLLSVGQSVGHQPDELLDAIRYVRVAVPDLKISDHRATPALAAWLLACDAELRSLAVERRLGRSRVLGVTPVEPVLQWREQVIAESDVAAGIASEGTVVAFRELADRLVDPAMWELV